MTEKRPKRCWYQFRLRTLLCLVVLTAVGLGGWQYWKILRPMWEVARAVSQSEFLSVEEKTVLRKLAWNREAWESGLIQQLVSTEHVPLDLEGLPEEPDPNDLEGFLEDYRDALTWTMNCSRMKWSGSFRDVDASACRLVMFQHPVIHIPPRSYPLTCIVTDDNYRLEAWEVVATGCMTFENAAIRPESPAVLTITCANWYGMRGTYRYQVSSSSIDQLGEPTWEMGEILVEKPSCDAETTD